MNIKPGIKQENNVCIICKKNLGDVSAARASHMRKHVRDGSIKETRDKKSNKLVWVTTGKSQSKPQYQSYRNYITKSTVALKPRIPNVGKSDKKGNIYIKCKVCQKWICATKKNVHSTFADLRFICVFHCEKMTIFPSRMVDILISNPGKEYIE